MFKRVIHGIFGTRHDRERRKIQPIVDEINEHYERLHGISEEELRAYLKESLFMSFNRYENEQLAALLRRASGVKEPESDSEDRG